MDLIKIFGKKVKKENITNPILADIIDEYIQRDSFMFGFLFGNSKHTDHREHKDGHCDFLYGDTRDYHMDLMEHEDFVYTDYKDYSEYKDHKDHTDAPKPKKVYSESMYHTDSNSPHYKK